MGNIEYDVISEYIGYEKEISCKCNICQQVWTTTPASLKQGCGCPNCGRIKASISRRTSNEEFISKLNNVNPNIMPLEEYINLKTPILCQCKKCNHIWRSRPDNLLYEHILCPQCSSSKNEIKLGNILSNLNIGSVEHHKRIKDCKYKHSLEFDYLVCKNGNVLFACEYDGEQHYIPIDFAGKGKEHAKQQLLLTQSRDKSKNEYCNDNQIPIIRIPYWEKNNMESFLLSKLNELKLI